VIRQWTFARRVGAGFAVTIVLAIMIGLVAITALNRVVSAKDRVIAVNAQRLIDAQRLSVVSERKSGALRAFLVTGENRYVIERENARGEFGRILADLRAQMETDEGRSLLDAIERSDTEYQAAGDRVAALRRSDSSAQELSDQFEAQVTPRRIALDQAIEALSTRERARLDDAREAASDDATLAMALVGVTTAVLVLVAAIAATFLTRALSRQIGTAVSQVQSSSAELQAAATQQATGSKEQATAMTEISTTINELLVTSRQIMESAQRVAQIAERTAAAARAGDETVDSAHESMAAIRRQVDSIVNHMLELGRKSQQIGSVVDIVSELAEQTNILSINATIEAAGAGESGRRFAAVAEEIRKLADRVAGSAKEIRELIENVRASVNTTVMATETGSKAVDAGSKQFGNVTASFKQIVDLVATTTEAAREIELSTKQQMTAVEQVNVAIANVAQASKETEASSGQTQQTASELTLLATDLLRLVQPRTGA
jgi:methyl-accepting chemotaxis protein